MKIEIEPPEGFEVVRQLKSNEWCDSSVLVRVEIKPIKQNPHAELIAQCEQDKIDYPDFWELLYQFKSPGGWKTLDKLFNKPFLSLIEHRSHTHRENIIAWHASSEEDKKRWECTCGHKVAWAKVIGHEGSYIPRWSEDYEYRLRPRICKVTLQDGTVMEYHEPVREPLEVGEEYFLASLDDDEVLVIEWKDYLEDKKWLKQGYIHLTKEAAEQHLAALQAINNQVGL